MIRALHSTGEAEQVLHHVDDVLELFVKVAPRRADTCRRRSCQAGRVAHASCGSRKSDAFALPASGFACRCRLLGGGGWYDDAGVWCADECG